MEELSQVEELRQVMRSLKGVVRVREPEVVLKDGGDVVMDLE